MISSSALSFLLALLSVIRLGSALECYVCDKQEDNNGKCLNTIKTCLQEENVCLTEISWGSTPYWSQGALKQYYISKSCSTEDKCARYRKSNMPLCTHIWYEDWKCSECCKGDRCNYYVISGSFKQYSNGLTIITSILIPFFLFKLFS